ncbi:MAG: ribosome hibernation-promoting factor, HPF/YfiA family [Planctomycetota bacterium]
MLFTISGKHIDVTEAVKSYAQEKTSKFTRYYDSINRVDVIIDGNKGGNIGVEVIARAEHNKIFIGKGTGEDPYKCIDLAVRKLERQLRRKKGKERDNKHTDSAELM